MTENFSEFSNSHGNGGMVSLNGSPPHQFITRSLLTTLPCVTYMMTLVTSCLSVANSHSDG